MNMHDCNEYMVYKHLYELHTPYHLVLDMTEAITELTHTLCQRGESMRKQKAGQFFDLLHFGPHVHMEMRLDSRENQRNQ